MLSSFTQWSIMSCIPAYGSWSIFQDFRNWTVSHMHWSFPVIYVPKYAAWLCSNAVFDFGLSSAGQDALHNFLYLEYHTFCCTTWKSLSEILHFLLHCLKIFISNAALSAALKKKSKKSSMLWRPCEEDVKFIITSQSLIHYDDAPHTMYEEEWENEWTRKEEIRPNPCSWQRMQSYSLT